MLFCISHTPPSPCLPLGLSNRHCVTNASVVKFHTTIYHLEENNRCVFIFTLFPLSVFPPLSLLGLSHSMEVRLPLVKERPLPTRVSEWIRPHPLPASPPLVSHLPSSTHSTTTTVSGNTSWTHCLSGEPMRRGQRAEWWRFRYIQTSTTTVAVLLEPPLAPGGM